MRCIKFKNKNLKKEHKNLIKDFRVWAIITAIIGGVHLAILFFFPVQYTNPSYLLLITLSRYCFSVFTFVTIILLLILINFKLNNILVHLKLAEEEDDDDE